MENEVIVEKGVEAETSKGGATAAALAEKTRSKLSPAEIFGTLVSLLARSPAHRHLFLGDLDWWLMPALKLGQLRIFHDGKQEIGFALWAKVSDEVDAELAAGRHKLRPADWNSGDKLWLMELVVPSANAKALQTLLGQLLKEPFKGQKFRMHMRDQKTGKLRAVVLGPKTSDEDVKAAVKDKVQLQ